ncbi:MAG: LysM peptidoglycan-binding domain-containing protein [Bauldia sp.]
MAPGAVPPPPVAYNPPAAPAMKPAMLARGGSTYVVQPGDTLFSVARKNATTVASLATLNGLATTASLQTGETLRITGSAPKTVAMAAPVKPAQQALGTPPHPLGTLTMKGEQDADAMPASAPAAPPKIRLASPADTAESGSQIAMNAPSAPAMPTIPVAAAGSDVAAPTNASVNAIDDAADAASTDGKQFAGRCAGASSPASAQAERREERRDQPRGAGRHLGQVG